jgi:oxygen-independent coproporphyrinogen-3 oxidase
LLIREFILQLKLGRVDRGYFQDKFGVDILERFATGLGELKSVGFVEVDDFEIRLTRDALLRVDGLLPLFFLERHRTDRYV